MLESSKFVRKIGLFIDYACYPDFSMNSIPFINRFLKSTIIAESEVIRKLVNHYMIGW